MEIERKWLFDSEKAPEEVKKLGEYYYAQAYLSVEPEFRIRSKRNVGEKETTYVLCIKSKGTLERVEVQKKLTEEEFKSLMIVGNLKEEDFIHKHIYVYDIEGKKLTLGRADVGRSTEFIYGEIEFESVEEAKEFEAPSWFGKEVTEDLSYKMANFWKRTRNTKNI